MVHKELPEKGIMNSFTIHSSRPPGLIRSDQGPVNNNTEPRVSGGQDDLQRICINRKWRKLAPRSVWVYIQIYSYLCSRNLKELTGYRCTELRRAIPSFLTSFIQQQRVIRQETEHAVMAKQGTRIHRVCSSFEPRKNALYFVITMADVV
jgi:hypothetical protein